MYKYTNALTTDTQKSATILHEITLYNQRVKENLNSTYLKPIVQHAIKIFKDSAQRRKLNNTQYNKEVEEFNKAHGFFIVKKGLKQDSFKKYYSYINDPYLDRLAVKKTMDNYRRFVANYNAKITIENEKIKKYNNAVVLKSFELSEEQKKDKKEFQKAHNALFIENYNTLVAEKNKETLLYLKKPLQKIKFHTELIFNVLVGFYVGQLKDRKAYLIGMNRPTSVSKNSLPKLKIDHRKLATHKIKDIPRLNICKKTAQNHIKRLREAGILINYLQINQNKPIQVNFNPQIIEILDGNEPKSQLTENKCFMNVSKNVLHDNNDTTRSLYLKKNKIKDYAQSIDLKKCYSEPKKNTSSSVSPAEGYKVTKGISKTIKPGGEIFKILPDYLKPAKQMKASNMQKIQAHNFLMRLEDDNELAKKLADGYYNGYKGLRREYLIKISMNPLIDRGEFRAVLLQDFIKLSAKIWKNSNVYVGNWKKAINQLNQSNLFSQKVTNNNTVNFHKTTQITYLKKYRWLLNFARKWFLKTEVTPLFPFAYFDNTRTNKKEVGFFGLHSVWKSHQKYQTKRNLEIKEQEIKSLKRKRRLRNQEKLNKALRKYELGKINHTELYNYVQDNLPHNFLSLI